jgi:L-asparaginase
MSGMGVVVVMAGKVIAADQAVKTHATAMDTFQAREVGPIAIVADGVVVPMMRRLARRTIPLTAAATPVDDVYLVTATVGTDGALLHGLAQARPRGVVIAATGSGNTSVELLDAARELMDEGTVVALTTRCARGTVDPIYAFPGGGATWARAGAILSTLDGPKTRVALALALAAGMDKDEIARLLDDR